MPRLRRAHEDEGDQAADPDRRGDDVGQVGERNEPAQAMWIERVAGERRGSEHEGADRRGREAERRQGERAERGERPGGACNRGHLGHPAEPRGVGGRLEREESEASRGDEHEPTTDDERLEPTPRADGTSGQRRAARDEHAREEEEAQQHR
jgi:hypothetical protein